MTEDGFDCSAILDSIKTGLPRPCMTIVEAIDHCTRGILEYVQGRLKPIEAREKIAAAVLVQLQWQIDKLERELRFVRAHMDRGRGE